MEEAEMVVLLQPKPASGFATTATMILTRESRFAMQEKLQYLHGCVVVRMSSVL